MENKMSLDYIRKTYKVPAKRGGKVIYSGSGKPQPGTIKSARGAYLRVQLESDRPVQNYHPTWKLEYL